MSESDRPGEPDPNLPPPPPPGWGTPPPPPPSGSSPGSQVPYPPQHGGQGGQPPWPSSGDQHGQSQPYGQPYGDHPAYQQPGGYGSGGYGTGGFPGPVTNQKAQWSLAVGLISVAGACCSAVLGLVGIAAIVLGIQARREIAASGGQQSGEGIATGGIVAGVVGTLLALLFGVVLGMLVIGSGLLSGTM